MSIFSEQGVNLIRKEIAFKKATRNNNKQENSLISNENKRQLIHFMNQYGRNLNTLFVQCVEPMLGDYYLNPSITEVDPIAKTLNSIDKNKIRPVVAKRELNKAIEDMSIDDLKMLLEILDIKEIKQRFNQFSPQNFNIGDFLYNIVLKKIQNKKQDNKALDNKEQNEFEKAIIKIQAKYSDSQKLVSKAVKIFNERKKYVQKQKNIEKNLKMARINWNIVVNAINKEQEVDNKNVTATIRAYIKVLNLDPTNTEASLFVGKLLINGFGHNSDGTRLVKQDIYEARRLFENVCYLNDRNSEVYKEANKKLLLIKKILEEKRKEDYQKRLYEYKLWQQKYQKTETKKNSQEVANSKNNKNEKTKNNRHHRVVESVPKGIPIIEDLEEANKSFHKKRMHFCAL